MANRSGDDARRDFGGHFAALARMLDEAHSEFTEKTREIAHKLETTTKAKIIRDLAVRRLREYCETASGAHFFKRGNLSLVGIQNNWLLRVKQLKAGFKVSVSPTAASRAYDRNEVPESMRTLLPDWPPATCLYLGWAIPENAPADIQKYLVCNNRFREIDWAIPIDSGSLPPPAELELGGPPSPPDGPDSSRRVRVKRNAERRSNE